MNDTISMDEGKTLTGNIRNNDDQGEDSPSYVTKISIDGKNYTVPSNGSNVSISTAHGTLTINRTGAYTYKAKDGNTDGVDNFVYTLTDGDGDRDTATFKVTVKDNDVPTAINGSGTTDDTDLSNGANVINGKINVNYNGDGPGTTAANGSFSSSGSREGGKLSHDGTAITVTRSGNTYTGKAGSETVFTMTINSNGTFKFTQYQNLDHGDTNNGNEALYLNFGVDAKDVDGDIGKGTIKIKILDDAPEAFNDTIALEEGKTVTGNVRSNDDQGEDSPSYVTKIVFDGKTYNVPSNGSNLTIDSNCGILTINRTGAYTYKAKDGNFDGTDKFTYTLTDGDGDRDTAILSVTVKDNDIPTAINGLGATDDSDLSNGANMVTGTINVNYNGDGPGTTAANGSFSSSGSREGGKLSHDGTAITVTRSGNTYTGKAGSETVFTMTINANGTFKFTQFENLDHGNPNDPNDVIYLNFGVKATDIDGDVGNGTVIIKVLDDAPVAVNDTATTEEGKTITGNVRSNDDQGEDSPSYVTKIVFGGKTYNVPSNGSNITIDANCGKLTINRTGAYTYAAKDGNKDGTDKFTYTLTDGDGDSDTAVLSVTVKDNDVPTAINGSGQTDDTDLSNGANVINGSINVNYNGDGPGTTAANGSFSSSGYREGNTLSHNGVNISVTRSGNTYTGKAGSETIFTMTINSNGSYKFTQYETLDHSRTDWGNEPIYLNFGVKATDIDGDVGNGTVQIKVLDDGVDAKDDATRTINEQQKITGNVLDNDNKSEDDPNYIDIITFEGKNYNVPSSGNLYISTSHGKLWINKWGSYTYEAKNGNVDGTDTFKYRLRDGDGDYDSATFKFVVKDDDVPTAISGSGATDDTDLSNGANVITGNISVNYNGDGPGTTSANGGFSSDGYREGNTLSHNGVNIAVTRSGNTYIGKAGGTTVFKMEIFSNGTYKFTQYQELDHSLTNNANEHINLRFGVNATDVDGDTRGGTITITVRDDGVNAKDDATRTINEQQKITGNVLDNDDKSEDNPNYIDIITFGGKNYNVPSSGNLYISTSHGKLWINKWGSYTYEAKNGNVDGTDTFKYRLRDGDGDYDSATFKFVVKDDDVPTAISGSGATDDTDLSNGANVITGNISVNYNGDGPGTTSANGGFSSDGYREGNTLSHNGVNIAVTRSGNTYIGKAGGTTVFKMEIFSNGTYKFTQYQELDHSLTNNANEHINLRFGVNATDVDGDTRGGTITITVRDDGVNAKDDGTRALDEGQSITGNVLSNDDKSEDNPNYIDIVTFGGKNYTVPASGNLYINTSIGQLWINKNGAYTYKGKGVNSDGTDTFTYRLRDGDGDYDSATFKFTVRDDGVPTAINGSGETDDTVVGNNGQDVETGTINVNYNGDGPGKTYANGGFSSGGNKEGGTLSHDGTNINVTLSGNTYTGKAGGKTIFTMTINQNGTYKFTQYENLDHSNTNNHNEHITLNFGVKAVDNDGDVGNGSVSITVRDDGPSARNDSASSGGRTASVNVLNNDDKGADDQDVDVISFKIGNTNYNITGGSRTINFGDGSSFTLNENGVASFKAQNNTSSGWGNMSSNQTRTDTIQVTYTMRDGDGDTSTATVTLSGRYTHTTRWQSGGDGGDGDGGDGDGCPLVIDLDGDGIELISKEDGVLFDINEDGIADKTAWVGGDDGILVLDKNEDGIINNHAEMFGNDEIGGFEMLSDYDTNNDGVIDANDDAWSLLQIWQDLNGDAISQANELLTLDELGIQSISLSVQSVEQVIAGNRVSVIGEITKTDGSTLDGYDAWFKYDDLAVGEDGQADTFLFQAIAESSATITNFNAEEGDAIDLSALIQGQDDVTDAINDFVYIAEENGNTIISVDVDGASGPAEAVEVAKLEDVSGMSVEDMVNSGNIII